VNPKKLSLAYKKYVNNFTIGTIIQSRKEKYETYKSKCINIIETNNLEKDHVLSISLGVIFNYHMMTWKEEVCVHNKERSEAIKQMQISFFYKCMGQDLYIMRYPNGWADSLFTEAIAALIHFAMFGWEKEENILFDFIAEHLHEKTINANNWSRHNWFLLELYLQYRNKTLLGVKEGVHKIVKAEREAAEIESGHIPDDLGIYAEVLADWSTLDEGVAADLIDKMIDFHSKLVSDLGDSIEYDYRYGFYPYEILFLLDVRKKKGLPVPAQFDALLMNSSEAKMVIQAPEPYPEKDELLVEIDGFYRKHYPAYFLHKYDEELFTNMK
jgi:hypothetical protein